MYVLSERLCAILDFFYERYEPGLFLHFEMIPDRFPEPLRDSIRRFPPGALQFEVGVQTFNERTAELISRRQDNQKLEENLRLTPEQRIEKHQRKLDAHFERERLLEKLIRAWQFAQKQHVHSR